MYTVHVVYCIYVMGTTPNNEMKNTKCDEDFQNFITESRTQHQETRSAQRDLEQNQSTTAHMLALFAEKFNLNIDLSNNDTPNNNNNNHQHTHPQQQQRQHQHSHAAITPVPNHRSQDVRQQPHLSLSQPTGDKTNPISP